MKTNLLLLIFFTLSTSLSQAQVGVGTTTPNAFFHVIRGQTVLFGEDSNYVNNANKFIWYASKGALRAGFVSSNSWNFTNIGQNSLATGQFTTASGEDATAVGYNTTASGVDAMAMGYSTTASGDAAISQGVHTVASGDAAISMGQYTKATGIVSTAIGSNNTASGIVSTAIGSNNTASGAYSTAMGNYVNTNQKQGSFIVGDYTFSSPLFNDAPNQMMMRFSGGYKLFTNANANIGVSLSGGGNAWQTLSDSTRKENFRPVDGVLFLQKIAKLKLGSWNYKGQDVKTFRHYGPMAQDFFAAFGHDELGIIGEDKSINQADFDGVNLIAIQALIKEVDQLKSKVEKSEQENQQLRAELGTARQTQHSTQARLDRIEALLEPQTPKTITFKP